MEICTKKCGYCNIDKPKNLKFFYKKKFSTGNYGFTSNCKICIKEKTRLYSEKNKQKKKESDKKYKEKVKSRIKTKIDTKKCGYCKIEKNVTEFNKDVTSRDGFQYSCKICKRKKDELYRQNNKEKIKKYKEENKEYNRNYSKKYKQIPKVKILENSRSRVKSFLKSKNITKSCKTIELIGCSAIFLKKWLEFQFNSNMNWENYGSYWHIDHVKPCISFDVEQEQEQKKCFHWTNLQPLEAIKNLSKNAKIVQKYILNQEIKVFYFKKLTKQHNQIAGISLAF